jgi:NADH-quinone oxidoreductase subunit A
VSGLVTVAGTSLLGVALAYAVHALLAPPGRPLAVAPFQSGWLPDAHALSRYHVRWYLVTLLFLAFDVEMLFMYPWAVVVADLGASAVVEMFVFLGALLVAVAWAWREGALRWV